SGYRRQKQSRSPRNTLRVLPLAAALIPLVYLAGSWILLRSSLPMTGTDVPYEQLVAASPFWGPSAPLIVTFLLASGSLLSCATAVSNTPRILYQLSVDAQLPAAFSQISRQGILGVSLTLTLLLSLAFLLWGDVTQIIFVTGLGWLGSFALFHVGLWQQRQQAYVRWPWTSLGFAALETLVIVGGGWAWGWQNLLLGLLLPGAVWGLFQAVGRFPQRPQLASSQPSPIIGAAQDWAIVQIAGLIGLLSGAIAASWLIHARVATLPMTNQVNLLMVVLLIGAAVGVAIAGWTTLPQITALGEAREQAEQFFNLAADGILVLDAAGQIQQANPASQELLQATGIPLINQSLPALFPDPAFLAGVTVPDSGPFKVTLAAKTLEIKLSTPTAQADIADRYVAIVRDITQRQAAEDALRQQTTELQRLLTELTQTQSQLIQIEKMSSLGQLIAGVAHEINNPLAFIAGNVNFAKDYALDLLKLIKAYQSVYGEPPPALLAQVEAIDLDFLQADFPKVLDSMEDGTKRILNIVQSLKIFSRHDESPTRVVDLHDGLESTLLILKNRLKAQGSRPEIEIQRIFSTLPPLECYPSALNQVFMNLIVNAIDALETLKSEEQQGPPTISITTCPKTQSDRPGIEIVVADNGPGIAAAQMDRLCNPFFTTKPVGKGTGLGLSISYQIVVERHQGSFTVASAPGSGAEFKIWLPLTLTKQAARSELSELVR
ncbi:MAG: amino acid permease, partial [Leptolyngbya sp. SIO4C5]|nr:amino acid permease [Leptolyngbya sp. SIO4C5]